MCFCFVLSLLYSILCFYGFPQHLLSIASGASRITFLLYNFNEIYYCCIKATEFYSRSRPSMQLKHPKHLLR